MAVSLLQVPLPLQVEAGVSDEEPEGHDWALQMVPDLYLRQAPAPSQVPSRPQVLTLAAVQSDA